MASTYSKLKIELIGTGDQSGTWGTTTNNNLGSSSTYRGLEQAIVGMATLETADFTANSYTLPYTDSNDDQDFRCLVLNITATLSGQGTVIVPPIQKPYIVINDTASSHAVTVKVSTQTGITVPSGAKVLLYNNGTDVGTAITYLTSLTLGSALPVASGGTGVTTSTGSGSLVLSTSPTLTTPRLAGSSTGYSSFASSNAGATNYTITFPDETMTVGFRNIPSAGTKTSSYTLASTDIGKYVQIGSGGSIVVPNSTFSDTVAINAGDVVSVINTNTTGITMTFNTATANISGSTTNKGGGGTVTLASRGIASIIFYSATACVITGAVS